MRLAKRTLGISVGIGAVPALWLYLSFGGAAVMGFLAGLALAMASIFSFTLLGALADLRSEAPRPIHGVTFLFFLVKLPLFALAIYGVGRLGGAAMACFLAGLGLVYSALVFGALLERDSKTRA
jgi:hypothetical protein